MNREFQRMIDCLEQTGRLTEEELSELIRFRDQESAAYMAEKAERIQKQHFHKRVLVVGSVDISNYCRNDCYYCALRRENRFLDRYRMTEEQIVECCEMGASQGIDCFLLQGGEDLQYTPALIAKIIRSIRSRWKGSRVWLALGEKSAAVYGQWKEAGAEGYLLRQEASENSYYKRLHPPNMSLLLRKQCLWALKELDYKLGAGFMVGAPSQKIANLAQDILFLKQLLPDIAVMGPFLPAEGTPCEKERAGGVELTCYLLSIVRLMMPDLLLPVAQTFSIADREAAVRGVRAGANVLVPDLTPPLKRSDYHAYSRRMLRGMEGMEMLAEAKETLREDGYEFVNHFGGW